MTPKRFVDLYRPVSRQLAGYARHLTHHPADADDLVQDTLLKAWAARRQFADGTNFRAWLSTIMRHEFLDRERVCRHRSRILRDHAPLLAAVQPASQESVIECRRAAMAIAALPPPFRNALGLQVYALTYRQCGRLLGCTEGTVKSRLSRARAALAARLGH